MDQNVLMVVQHGSKRLDGLRAEMPKLGESNNGNNNSSNGNSSSTTSNNNVSNASTNGTSGSSSNDVTRVPGPHSYSPVPTQKTSYANGSYSPHSTVNGTPTPSPPALSSPPSQNHESGPGAGASSRDAHRQISKVRRFLTTLHQFAADISHDVGDRVRHLVLGLLSGGVSVEEFHGGLQEVTHFPLRPFVLPFLRSHLPLLQRELQSLARRAAMPVSQYVAVHEAALLESTAGEPTDFFSSEVTSSKRRHEGYFENGDSGGGSGGGVSPPPSKRLGIFSPPYPSVGMSPDPPLHSRDYRTPAPPDDEWKNIHVMLTCILSMVEKTRRALTMLQQKEDRDGSSGISRVSGLGATDLRQRADYDAEVRRHAAELVAQSIRTTEERVSEVKRKAEEAVSEVRRAAVAEVQRAVGAAEARAQELVAAERAKVEALLREVGRRDSSEPRAEPQQACWNCGRKAHETCSGCNVARYCGPFCQHKDWDSHHKVCSPVLASSSSSSASSSSASSSTAIIAALVSKSKFSKTSDTTKTE
ncbi:protein CBFA2T1 isoform X3 [Cherax quadricarinatus]|uniref:protein CBFA2T1 isoform X3 n=1 Tax=Cherax quadricarinatus TaxID=27406 RepID=UPI0023784CB6|nr:protein CBFA2T1-like isoform X3 [Cherax quadricarinatus]